MSQLGYAINLNEITGGSLLTYTPVVSSAPGTCTVNGPLGFYQTFGKLVYVFVRFNISAFTGGAGTQFSFSLPVNAGVIGDGSPVSVLMGQLNTIGLCFVNIPQTGFRRTSSTIFDQNFAVITSTGTYQLSGWYLQ